MCLHFRVTCRNYKRLRYNKDLLKYVILLACSQWLNSKYIENLDKLWKSEYGFGQWDFTESQKVVHNHSGYVQKDGQFLNACLCAEELVAALFYFLPQHFSLHFEQKNRASNMSYTA